MRLLLTNLLLTSQIFINLKIIVKKYNFDKPATMQCYACAHPCPVHAPNDAAQSANNADVWTAT